MEKEIFNCARINKTVSRRHRTSSDHFFKIRSSKLAFLCVIHSTLHFTSVLPYELIGVVGALSAYKLMLLLTVHRLAVLLLVFNLFLRNAGRFELEVSCINS